MAKLIGYLGCCSTPYCGGIYGYFCVKCRHYASSCQCLANEGGCTCREEDYGTWWASTGERRSLERELTKKEQADDQQY